MFQHTPAISTHRGRQWNNLKTINGIRTSPIGYEPGFNPVLQGLRFGNLGTFDLAMVSS